MSDPQVSQIKERIDIVSLIGERVQLKKAGKNFKGLCPFHGEKTPSFFVTPDIQIYKCFGCGASGDVFSFVQAFEGVEFPEALEMLATKAGVKLDRVARSPQEQRREKLLEMLNMAAEYYHYLLVEHSVGKKAWQYLHDRGLHPQTIKDFRLGYSLSSWDGLIKYLVLKKKYEIGELEAAGLVIKRSNARGNTWRDYYDRFRGRVMFPLKDFSGKVVGFSGRVLEKDVKEAKYINSPETTLFHKGELLYGLSQARSTIRKKERVVVVEGEMDVIGSYQVGLKEVVAVKGSALTEHQVLQLRKLTSTIILALDADEAGQEAIKRGIEVAEKLGVTLRVVRITGGKDPADLASADPKKWRALVDEAVSIYQFFIDSAFSLFDASTGIGQKQISQFLAPILYKIENKIEQSYYMKKLAERLGVSERVVEEEVMRGGRLVATAGKTTVEPSAKKALSRQELLERYVVSVGMQLPRMGERFLELKDEWFSEAYLARLVAEMKQHLSQEPGMKVAQLIELLPPEQQPLMQQLFTADLGLLETDMSTLEKTFNKAVVDLERIAMRERFNELTRSLSSFSGSDEERSKLQVELQSLSAKLAQVNSG